MALIPDTFRKSILGDTEDSNGAIVENANADRKTFALMFEFDGDAKKKTRHVLYNVWPTGPPSVEGTTKSNSPRNPKTETLEIRRGRQLIPVNVKGQDCLWRHRLRHVLQRGLSEERSDKYRS